MRATWYRTTSGPEFLAKGSSLTFLVMNSSSMKTVRSDRYS